jgi:nitroreductase
MELETGIRERRSIRAFLDRPVPRTTLLDLLDIARWSPSWANTQSPTLYVATGPTLDDIKRDLRKRTENKAPRKFDIAPPNAAWPKHLAARTERLILARTDVLRSTPKPSTSVGPADFFGAPAVVYVTVDEGLQPEYALFDAGILTQSFCLVAHDRGLGTCIMAMAVAYPDALRARLPQAAGKQFVVGIALGYPDLAAPINQFTRERAALTEQVTWTGQS